MLTYSFDEKNKKPLYLQLYEFIKNDILGGNLKAEQKLPSKRSFSENLGVSVITVENAYEQLIAEGYIFSSPKKGFFVSDITQIVTGTVVDSLKEKTGKSENGKYDFLSQEKEYDVDFSSNNLLSSHFPYSVWARVLRDCLNKYEKELLQSAPAAGCFALRKAVSEYLYSYRGMKINPEQIIIGAGTEYLYGLLVQLLGREKLYCVEDPGYKKVSKVYEANGACVCFSEVTESGIEVDDLESKHVDVLHISPGHQFPTGIITPVSKRREILSWSSKSSGRYIIEDDYDSEFRMTGVMIPTLQSIDTEGKVIYLNTFTKTLSSSIRVSYMVLPPDLLEVFYRKLSFYSCPVSSVVQYAIAEFIERGFFEKHINRLKNFYRRQRDTLIREIKISGLSKYAEVMREDSGLHFLLKLKISCKDEEFRNIMEKEKIRLRPLSEYFHRKDSESEHIFVMNYSSLTEKAIKESVQKILKHCSSKGISV